ncbi:MAG: hypothetical protein ACO1NQ_14110 [Flavobacteriales bacterium]
MRYILIVPILAACSGPSTRQPADLHGNIRSMRNWVAHAPDIDRVNLTQRTCALYVALRSHAWKEPIAFGRDLDDGLVHWNMCPGGTMVACASAPTASGDSVITGIPWPY